MNADINRRDFLTAATTGIALATLSQSASAAEFLEDDKAATAISSAFAANHELKPLPFDASKLDGLSEKLIKSHWENNYGGSVKALNTVKQRLQTYLDDANTPPFIYNDLKREHLLRNGSVILHDLYFGNLGGSDKADTRSTNFWLTLLAQVPAGKKNLNAWALDWVAAMAGWY